MAWGKYLEVIHGKLMLVFMSKIPESFLPFPKEMIEEAVNKIAEQHWNQGNKQAVETLQSTIPFLMAYANDEDAFASAAERFKDKKYLDVVLPSLKTLSVNLQPKF